VLKVFHDSGVNFGAHPFASLFVHSRPISLSGIAIIKESLGPLSRLSYDAFAFPLPTVNGLNRW